MDTLFSKSSAISIVKKWKIRRMKSIFYLRIFSCVVILLMTIGFQKSYGQGVGISEESIVPHVSSILELRYTSGSFKGFLAPRLTTVQRTAIASPAAGLLVYDTSTKSFWYYDGGWVSIAASQFGSSNQVLGMNAAGTANEYKTLNGTANQISISHGVGNITFSTPQDIHAGATPTFLGLTLSTPLGVPSGGTGLTTFGGTNTVLYTSATDALNSVATSTANGQFLQTTTAGGAPTWKTILDVANGGTGLSSITTNNLIYGNNAGAVNLLTPSATTGALLTTTATGAPGWLTLNTLPATSGILQTVNGGTGYDTYTDGELLIGTTAGSLNRTTLTGTANRVSVTNGDGSITLSTPQDIHNAATPTFVGLTLSGLTPDAGVYTDGS
ncbi:MAG: hypothetical protein IIB05_01920, partial [Bacteroidetes bacterium]|nr:hypothetical protein [Bacteroidota bacterium]